MMMFQLVHVGYAPIMAAKIASGIIGIAGMPASIGALLIWIFERPDEPV
jgi:hypothetical protein